MTKVVTIQGATGLGLSAIGLAVPSLFPQLHQWVALGLLGSGVFLICYAFIAHLTRLKWEKVDELENPATTELAHIVPVATLSMESIPKPSLTDAETVPCYAALAELEQFLAGPVTEHIQSLRIAGNAPNKLTPLVDGVEDLRKKGDDLRGGLVQLVDRNSHWLATILHIDVTPVIHALEMLYNPCQRVFAAKDWPLDAVKERANELAAANGNLDNAVQYLRQQIAAKRRDCF